jgi:hypothetical protein|tara:strand:+ start:901 stop:1167 length:267 start_codon:yes stop_codon:yes gene_type:complete
MDKLIPGEPLIYERADGVVYARYRDKPEIERWLVGGDPAGVARAQGKLLDYSEWQNLCELAQTNETLKKQLKNLVNTYFMVKDTQWEE